MFYYLIYDLRISIFFLFYWIGFVREFEELQQNL